jgi:hypothetical protein
MTVFWDVAPCSLAEVYRRFRGACCLHTNISEVPTASVIMTECNLREELVSAWALRGCACFMARASHPDLHIEAMSTVHSTFISEFSVQTQVGSRAATVGQHHGDRETLLVRQEMHELNES